MTDEVLADPSGYGIDLSTDSPYSSGEDVSDTPKGQTVIHALSDLHHAISDSVSAWRPYRKPASEQDSLGKQTRLKPGKQNAQGRYGLSNDEDANHDMEMADNLGARTRIGKCTILFNGDSYWERAIRTHEIHDKIHGYRLHVLRQSLMDDVWSKPAYVLSLLLREMSKPEGERLEWLIWVDADTVILNPLIPIETFLPPPGPEFEDIHLVYSNDWNGLNNGVFPVRVSRWAIELFSAIVSYRHYHPDEVLTFRDQSAMDNLMKEPRFRRNIVQAPQRWFNAYQGELNETLAPHQIRRGDLLVHFAGVIDRKSRMGYWLARAEQHLDDWEIPLKSTSYPQEAQDFWEEQRVARKTYEKTVSEIRVKATEILAKTERRLDDYGERLRDEERAAIVQQQSVLKSLINDAKWQDDVAKVQFETRKLAEIAVPLLKAVAAVNQVLLSSAHDAIFAAEKELLDGGFHAGVTNAELLAVSNAAKRLKNLVMTSEDYWSKQDIIVATNMVNDARAKLHASTATVLIEIKATDNATAQADVQQKSKVEQMRKAKQLEEARRIVSEASRTASTVVHKELPSAAVQVATSTLATVFVEAEAKAKEKASIQAEIEHTRRLKQLEEARRIVNLEAGRVASATVKEMASAAVQVATEAQSKEATSAQVEVEQMRKLHLKQIEEARRIVKLEASRAASTAVKELPNVAVDVATIAITPNTVANPTIVSNAVESGRLH